MNLVRKCLNQNELSSKKCWWEWIHILTMKVSETTSRPSSSSLSRHCKAWEREREREREWDDSLINMQCVKFFLPAKVVTHKKGKKGAKTKRGGGAKKWIRQCPMKVAKPKKPIHLFLTINLSLKLISKFVFQYFSSQIFSPNSNVINHICHLTLGRSFLLYKTPKSIFMFFFFPAFL